MAAALNSHTFFADVTQRIAYLPANKRIDALLDYFGGVLDAMDTDVICRLRDQIMQRFSTCGCSFEGCLLMIEFINGHLALRERTAGIPAFRHR